MEETEIKSEQARDSDVASINASRKKVKNSRSNKHPPQQTSFSRV